MMKPEFQIRRLDGNAGRFVQDIFVVHLPKEVLGKQKFIPSMHPHLIFLIQGQLILKSKKRSVSFSDVLLHGMYTSALEFEVLEDTIYAGISFKPAAAHLLFDINMRKYVDNALPPKKVIKKYDLNHFRIQLKTLDTIEEKLHALETFVVDLTQENETEPTLIEECLTTIHKADGCIRSKELQRQFNVSDKYLEKLFFKTIGVTPAKYAKSFRFFSAVKTVVQESPDLKNVMDRYEYFDNSHFRKDFVKFTKEKPEDFFQKNYVLVNSMFKSLTPPNR